MTNRLTLVTLNDNHESSLRWLVRTEDIKDYIYTANLYTIEQKNGEELAFNQIRGLWKEHKQEHDLDEFCELFNLTSESMAEYTESVPSEDGGTIVFDDSNGEFWILEDYFTQRGYSWWDGHSFAWIFPEDEEEVTVSEESCSLDTWDGHNFTSSGVGEHQQVYKVIGEENMYLLKYWSQWQGEHAKGQVMSFEEVLKHVKDALCWEDERDIEDLKERLESL